jgi:5'-3' exonuclease
VDIHFDVLIIDGTNLAHRAWHRASVNDEPMQTILESMAYAAYRLHAPRYAAVVYDAPRSIRSMTYPAYKAGRAEKPPNLRRWLDDLRCAHALAGIPVVLAPDREADDVMACLAAQAYGQRLMTTLLTSDRDAYMLVNRRTWVAEPVSGLGYRYTDAARVRDVYGVDPSDLPHWKALAGDMGDNIPGVRGVGPVKATRILAECPGADEIRAWLRAHARSPSAGDLRVAEFDQALDLVSPRYDCELTRGILMCEVRP